MFLDALTGGCILIWCIVCCILCVVYCCIMLYMVCGIILVLLQSMTKWNKIVFFDATGFCVLRYSTFELHIVQGVFFTGTPLKSSKYKTS